MSEVTVNNELKLGICFKEAAQLYFFQTWLDPTIIYRYPVVSHSDEITELNL
jgi:hypothetical protein